MKFFSNAMTGIVLISLILFFAIVLSTAGGALAGWIVGLFFADTILGIFASLGVQGFAMWQLGAFLGFVGGFFKSTATIKD